MYALLNNVNSDNEEETDNLINDSETGFIGDEEILPANNTLNTLLATPEANIHLIRAMKNQKKPDKQKKGEPSKWTKKAKANEQDLFQKYKHS